MESLVHSMLSNAVAAAILALAVTVFGRFCRRPALIHCLWLVVLLKLISPPVFSVSLPSLVPAYIQNLANERKLSASRIDHPIAVAREQHEGDQPDDLPFAPESSGALSDDRLASASFALMDVVNDGPGEERRSSEPTSRREPTSQGTPRPADRTFAPPTWAIRLIAMSARLPWEALALFVVLLGAVAWWSLAMVRIVRFHRVLKDGSSVPREWQDQSDELAECLGLTRRPEVHLVPGQVPPMLWAIGRRPRLLIPSQLWPTLQPDEQTSLLLHELAHLRRRDHWVRWLELLVGGLYWWHPAVWWARRALREAEEQCCDAWVVWAMPRAAKTYAAALLAALEFVSGARTAPAAASATSGNGHVSCLKRRLRMIVRASTPKGLSWMGRLAVLGTAVLILPLAPSWAQDNHAKPGQTKPEQLNRVEAAKASPDANTPLESRAPLARLARLANDNEDEPKDDKSREAAKRLEDQARDLVEKLTREFGPVGDEFRKVLERAVGEVHKSLEKENLSSDDLRKALEKSQDELRRALEQGGPIDHELREALERSRKELREAWEHAREDIRQVMRDRIEVARQHQREQAEQAPERPEHTQPEARRGGSDEAETHQHRQEVENTRREIRELEQQLRRANRRLEELDRRETRRETRRPPARPRAEAEPSRPPAARSAPTPPRAESTPAPPATPARPGQRNIRRPNVPFGAPGPGRTPGPATRPDYERRFQNLEDKLNQLLKELQDMKRDQRSKTSAKADDRIVMNLTASLTAAV
jgi:bla regulator protein blaR1